MIFDTVTLTWRTTNDLPYPLSAFSVVTDGKSVFLFGDYEQMDAIHRYDPGEGKLFLLDEKITPRRHTAAVEIGGKAIIIGGNQTSVGKALSIIESFDLKSMSPGKEAHGSEEE